jgi:hypothetical protein
LRYELRFAEAFDSVGYFYVFSEVLDAVLELIECDFLCKILSSFLEFEFYSVSFEPNFFEEFYTVKCAKLEGLLISLINIPRVL